MYEKKVAVLIPFWIQDTLRRNNLPLNACLELEKLKPIVGLNDLIAFATMQDSMYFKRIAGTDHMEELSWTWDKGIIKSNEELKDLLWKTIIPASVDVSIHNELAARLFSVESKLDAHSVPFAIHDLTPEAFGIVIYPGYFINDNNIVLQKDVIEKIIETLYKYYSFHEVARTLFFRGYLEILSKNSR